jgi:hypothetical protein
MVLALGAVLGIVVGFLLGGSLSRLADLKLRGVALLGLALVMQLVAYPPVLAPPDGVATAIWLASYGLIIVVALLNRRVHGFPLATMGMLSNLVAVIGNGGHMPALKSAMIDAGVDFGVRANSELASSPNFPWLIDRWGAPWWVPMANVYSVGDVLLTVGAVVIVAAGMGARLPRLPRRQPA